MNDLVAALVWYVAFVLSATLHEAAHALAAKLGGDPTAYEGGQVSIDPVPHIRREPVGMVVLPILSLAIMGWPFGFASAPYSRAWAEQYPQRAAWMSLAGPGANLLLVIGCAAFIWFGVGLGELQAPPTAHFTQVVVAVNGGLWESAAFIVSVFFTLNLILLLFNLIPLPPLDGSGALPLLLPEDVARRVRELSARPMVGFIGLLIVWRVFGAIFGPVFTFALNLLYPGAGYHG
jgi:Zn-dependent protease